MVNKDFLECCDVVLLIEHEHGFLIVDRVDSTECLQSVICLTKGDSANIEVLILLMPWLKSLIGSKTQDLLSLSGQFDSIYMKNEPYFDPIPVFMGLTYPS